MSIEPVFSGPEWIPQPKQAEFLSSPARELLFGGARGGGKSEAGFIWLARPAIGPKLGRFRGLVLRETAQSLADWVDRADEIYSKTGATLRRSPTPHFIWPWGAKIYTGHLKDQQSIKKYVGREFQRILIEELTQLQDYDLYVKLLGSCRSTIKNLEARIAGTTNPGGPGHYWVKKRFVDPAPPGVIFREEGSSLTRQFIPSLVDDNQILCKNDPAYVEYLDSLPEKLKRAWRYGDWSILEGSFYPEFTRRQHTCEPFDVPDTWARYRALDWGYWPDPAVCVWFAVSPDTKKRREVAYRERHWFRTIPEDVSKDIQYISRRENIMFSVADPSMWASKSGPSDAEKMIASGLPLLQADNSRVQGWARVHELLKLNAHKRRGEMVHTPTLKIFNTCVKLIEAVEIAQHSEKNPMDVAPNKLDHWLDALRYYSMSRSSKGRYKDEIPDVFSLKAIRYRRARNG